MSDLPQEFSHVDPDAVVELDVRPILAEGGKPFDAIMDAISNVSPDGALQLVAPFKPTPLQRVLEREGWRSVVERVTDGWIIWFAR